VILVGPSAFQGVRKCRQVCIRRFWSEVWGTITLLWVSRRTWER